MTIDHLTIDNPLQNSGAKHPTIDGLANEWISYILTRDQYINGQGYEFSVSFYGPGLGELISTEVIKTALPVIKKKK